MQTSREIAIRFLVFRYHSSSLNESGIVVIGVDGVARENTRHRCVVEFGFLRGAFLSGSGSGSGCFFSSSPII